MTPDRQHRPQGREARRVAISADGLKAAVVLGERVGLVDMTTLRLMRRTKKGALAGKAVPRKRGGRRAPAALPGGVGFTATALVGQHERRDAQRPRPRDRCAGART